MAARGRMSTDPSMQRYPDRMRMVGTLMFFCTLVLAGSLAHSSTKANRAAGEATYRTAGCAHCHGDDLGGTERGPDLRAVGRSLRRDALLRQIHEGGGGMPPFHGVLSDGDIANLVDFLQAQRSKPKQAQPAPDTAKTDPDR